MDMAPFGGCQDSRAPVFGTGIDQHGVGWGIYIGYTERIVTFFVVRDQFRAIFYNDACLESVFVLVTYEVGIFGAQAHAVVDLDLESDDGFCLVLGQ